MESVKDAFGQRIKAGDRVGYAGQVGRHPWLLTGTVSETRPVTSRVAIEADHTGRAVTRRGKTVVRAVIPKEDE